MEEEREENRSFLMEGIINQIKFGFDDPETVIADVTDQVADEGWEADFSEEWIREAVMAAYEERVAQSKTWQHPTQTEKLVAAFDQLRKEKIVALHFAGYTQSDSLDDVNEIVQHLKEQHIQHTGHCFYHEQDLTRVLEEDDNNELLLGFYGAESNNEAMAVAAGNRIKAVLEAAGFDVAWDGNPAERMAVMNFIWQNVYTSDDDLEKWIHERVYELIA